MKNSETLTSADKETAVVLSAHHVPADYFKNRKGLFVWSGFKSRILGDAKSTAAGAEFKVSSFDLAKPVTDEQIEEALPKDHLFSISDVCAIIADLISKQPAGEEGVLLNNGYVNLFYTKDCVVGVLWGSFLGEWRVGAWGRGGDGWLRGFRVFSPATVA